MRPLIIATLAVGAGAACATPAIAKDRKISPYIELSQVLTADVQNGDVLTYTNLAAGIDASLQSRRTQVQISYRYDHRFAYNQRLTDADIHSGLARANFNVASGISIEGGAIATRTRSDVRGDAPGILAGNVSNISQVYSLYAGPSIATHAGPIGVTANYRYGYTKVEAPGLTGVAPNQPRLDVYDSSHNQLAAAALSLKPGVVLPVGVTVSGGWEQDEARQLSQRYTGKYARGDVLYPVAPTIALVAGVGYENIEISQRDPLRDANGQPVVDSRGRFVENTAAPRRIAYNFDGIYYDAGVVWRPSPRTMAEVHVGRRYGSISYTGSVTYQPTRSVALAARVYDGVTTFGRQLRDGLSTLPTSFTANGSALGPDYNGCVFGANGSAGGCLNGVFQSVSTAAFRARGADAVATFGRGNTRFGVGAGYTNRKFLAPAEGGVLFTANGVTDESYYVQAFASRALDSRTTVDANVFANFYDSGIAGASNVYSVGGTVGLGRSFGRLSARVIAGLYAFSRDGQQTVVNADALIGARYQF